MQTQYALHGNASCERSGSGTISADYRWRSAGVLAVVCGYGMSAPQLGGDPRSVRVGLALNGIPACLSRITACSSGVCGPCFGSSAQFSRCLLLPDANPSRVAHEVAVRHDRPSQFCLLVSRRC